MSRIIYQNARLFTILFLGIASACAGPLREFSADAGQAAAQRDIASGHMRIYIAGTRGSGEIGVEPVDRAVVADLPRDRSLPVGCTVPQAGEAAQFARAYNSAIVHHLRAAAAD